MKRSIAMMLLLSAGCAGMMDSPVVPMNMPVAQAVVEIEVTPRGQAPILTIKNRKQIDAVMRALEGEGKDWYRPTKFPTEDYALLITSRGGRGRVMLLGNGWFGGKSGETRILRRLTKDEEEEIHALLGIAKAQDD